MPAPTQIAVIDLGNHTTATANTGTYIARILTIGTPVGDSYTLTGADVAAGALVVPIVPVSTLVTAPNLSVEIIGAEPVISTEGGAITLTIALGPYAGTYTTQHDGTPLTVALVEQAPVCLVKPVVSGDTAAGNTLTITPGLWLYAGVDPGDQSWVQLLAGESTGQTDLDYIIQAADAGKSFTVEETFGGVTVTSAATAL